MNTEDSKMSLNQAANKYSVFVSSHPGKRMSDNEDNFIVNKTVRVLQKNEEHLKGNGIISPLVCAVFDGMGGESNGKTCSKIAAETSMMVYKTLKDSPTQPDEIVNQFVQESNDSINKYLSENKLSRGGSTFIMAIIIDDTVYSYSLGDSRLYLYSKNNIYQISNDHTLAMKKYLANIYTIEEASSGPDSHKLTSFLGLDVECQGLKPEKYPSFKLKSGEKLLLCSDGLYDMCKKEEILSELASNPNMITIELTKKAISNGGFDNTTCIVIEKE